MGITATVIDPADMASLQRVLEERDVSLFFSESPTNPYLRCVDVRLISRLCHANGAVVCIDSTFATPINQRAIEFGADIVIHSATKYLGGHNDVLGGERDLQKGCLCVYQIIRLAGNLEESFPTAMLLQEYFVRLQPIFYYLHRSFSQGHTTC